MPSNTSAFPPGSFKINKNIQLYRSSLPKAKLNPFILWFTYKNSAHLIPINQGLTTYSQQARSDPRKLWIQPMDTGLWQHSKKGGAIHRCSPHATTETSNTGWVQCLPISEVRYLPILQPEKVAYFCCKLFHTTSHYFISPAHMPILASFSNFMS